MTSYAQMSPINPLHKQLEQERFARAIAHVEQTAQTIKRLNANELGRLNQMLNGHTDEPWRSESATVKIPSGKVHSMSVMSNPLFVARDVIELANQLANQDLIEGAFQLYSRLVLAHLFKDANRRTAALATLWFMRAHGGDIDVVALSQTPVGDLREEGDVQKLKAEMQSLSKKA